VLARGATLPRHEHFGPEINLVLEGSLVDAGVAHGPGSVVASVAGSVSDYQAGRGRDLNLVAGHDGIR
jgi:anti-sigma factor ChrR (cupin superfamily)